MKERKNSDKKNGTQNLKSKIETDTYAGNGWVKAIRSGRVEALVGRNHGAAVLLWIIAVRAWRHAYVSPHGCLQNEAFLGDWEALGFTHKGYRIAKQQLEELGYASFRATNRGTIATIIGTTVFDINAEAVTERTVKGQTEGNQGAIKGQTEGNQGANEGQTEGNQGAPNKKSISEELKKGKNQKSNNNNNTAENSAEDAGVVVTPSVSPSAGAGEGATEAETEAPYQPQEEAIPQGEVEIEANMTPSQKAVKFTHAYSLYVKGMLGLKSSPTFNQTSMEACVEYFTCHPESYWFDPLAICAEAMRLARSTPAPTEGFDTLFWCRTCAHVPNKIFGATHEGDAIMANMEDRTKYAYDVCHDDLITKLNADVLRVATKKEATKKRALTAGE